MWLLVLARIAPVAQVSPNIGTIESRRSEPLEDVAEHYISAGSLCPFFLPFSSILHLSPPPDYVVSYCPFTCRRFQSILPAFRLMMYPV